jgi:hypothetical protein
MFSKASTKAKENRREKKKPYFTIHYYYRHPCPCFKTKAVAAEIQETVVVVDQVYWISKSSPEVAEEVVLAADLLVEDLAAEAADLVVDLAEASEVARVEVGNRL